MSALAAGAVYLDHNATTPPRPAAVAAMLHAAEHAWGNPSSTHAVGQAARALLIDARARVARLFDCAPTEVIFTSGATESNHTAVLGALAAHRDGARRQLALSAIEHPGLLALAERLREQGTPVSRLAVDRDGQLDLQAAAAAIGPTTAVVSVMAANNETGVLQPLAAVAQLAAQRGAWLHVDATQMAGRLPLSFAASGADLMSVSAHKFGGPRGVGALLVRKGLALPPLLAGRQERQRRGGTENLPAIAGFAAACDAVGAVLEPEAARLLALRQRLEAGLRATLPGVAVFSEGVERLPNTTCLRFGALDAGLVLARLERAGVLASSGAACGAGSTTPSHVLLAMGCDAATARSGVRLSLGWTTTAADIEDALQAARRALGPLLQPAPAPLLQPALAAAVA